MHKVTKILVKILSTLTLLIIFLPFLFSLLLSLESVQTFVVRRAADVASSILDTRVEVGRASIDFVNSVTLSDVLIEDKTGEMMLTMQSLKLNISALKIASGNIWLDGVEANNVKFALREVVSDTLNIQQVILPFIDRDRVPKNKIFISDIKLHNADVTYERMRKFHPENGVDLGDMALYGANIEISSLSSINKITTLNIAKLSGKERSGFTIDNISTQLTIDGAALLFDNLLLTTPASQVSLPTLTIRGERWPEYKNFEQMVNLNIVSRESTLAMSDVAYFAPKLWGNDFTARNLTLQAKGTIADFALNIDNASFAQNSSLSASGTIKGLPDFNRSTFNINVKELKSDARDIDSVMVGFGKGTLPEQQSDLLRRAAELRITASARGEINAMNISASLNSWLGSVSYIGALNNVQRDAEIKGDISLKDINAGALLDRTDIGYLTLSSQVDGILASGAIIADAVGQIEKIDFNSYCYQGVTFDLSYIDERLNAEVTSHDKNLDMELLGVADFSSEWHHYDFTMRLSEANLNALHINRRDSIATVAGSMRINLEGDKLDNMNGNITLRNINYTYNNSSLYTPMISIVGRNSEKSKNIELKSEFVDMSFSSKTSFDELYTYLDQSMRKYIPMLYSKETERNINSAVTIADNYSTLKVDFKHFAPISDAIFKGFNIADNSLFNVMFNPHSDRFSMRLTSEFIEHNTLAATDLNINASNDSDSLSLYATARNVYLGVTGFSSYSLMAGARNNMVEISTGFRDVATNTSATLGMRARFDSLKTAYIRLLPSQFKRNDNSWLINSDGIVASPDKIDIDDFSIVNGEQRLEVNGAISKNAADSVSLKLNNYDISILTSVISELGYNIEGTSSGYINIKSALGEPQVQANVTLDSIYLNSIPSPPLLMRAGWDTASNRAGVYITNRVKRDTLIKGYYIPQERSYYGHLKVDSVDMSLIDPLLSSTISDTKGLANVDVTINGQERQAKAKGQIDIYDMSTNIDFTNVRYSLPSARIDIEDNVLKSQSNQLYDKDGNSGLLTMQLSLDHLSNVAFNMRITPENMLVLNTSERDNELFYGTLYASGVATIRGDKSGVNMDITATSERNSEFYMPLSTRSSVAKTDFITFAKEVTLDPKAEANSYRRDFAGERLERLNATTAQRLNINMAIHATPDLDFQLVIDPVVGDIIKAKGDGRLNMQISPNENIFEMYGDYSITEGSYNFMLLNPIIKRFTIDSGSSIQWSGDAMNPLLNIDAVYKTKTSLEPLLSSSSDESSSRAVPVECIIHLGDRLTQPSVSFSIDVPSADLEQQAVIANTLVDQESISRQFFYLMFANSFIPVTSSIGSELSSSTSASTGFDLLTNQLSNWLSSSNLNWVIRYRPESELTSDEIDLGFSRGLIDNRLLIEVEGNYLADNKSSTSTESASNFMGEAYITWLIDRAGTLRLKGFTQNIDSYDENQGLQETGIGIYYQESFNNFRELPQLIIDRFSRKKKIESNN